MSTSLKGHYNGPSGDAPVTLQLEGRWKMKGLAEAVVVEKNGSTLLTLKCRDGKSCAVQLDKVN